MGVLSFVKHVLNNPEDLHLKPIEIQFVQLSLGWNYTKL